MNLIIDSRIFNKTKTGIRRYSDELTKKLLDDNFEITLSKENLSKELFVYEEINHLDYSNTLKIGFNDFECKRLIVKEKGKFIREIFRIANKLNRPLLATKNLAPTNEKGQSIYHSTFLPFTINPSLHYQRVITIHDLIPYIYPQHFENSNQRFTQILKCAASIEKTICVSESTANDLLKALPHLNSEKIFVTPLAASDDFNSKRLVDDDALRSRLKIPKNKKILLSVCTLEPRKNLEAVIRTWKQLQNIHKDWVLVLVGASGWGGVKSKIEAEHDLKNVLMTGFIKDKDLYDLYSIADLFVYPSIYEGFGLPVLEAMQSGLPVVTSNNSSLPEVVGKDYPTISPEKDIEIFSQLDLLMRDESQRVALKSHGLNRAKQFNWSKTAELTLQAYKA